MELVGGSVRYFESFKIEEENNFLYNNLDI